MFCGVLNVSKKVLRRHKIPKQVAYSHERDSVKKAHSDEFLKAVCTA